MAQQLKHLFIYFIILRLLGLWLEWMESLCFIYFFVIMNLICLSLFFFFYFLFEIYFPSFFLIFISVFYGFFKPINFIVMVIFHFRLDFFSDCFYLFRNLARVPINEWNSMHAFFNSQWEARFILFIQSQSEWNKFIGDLLSKRLTFVLLFRNMRKMF